MESWRKTSLVLPTPPVAYSGTIRFTCSGTMRIRENEQHYKSKKPDPTYYREGVGYIVSKDYKNKKHTYNHSMSRY